MTYPGPIRRAAYGAIIIALAVVFVPLWAANEVRAGRWRIT